MSTLTPERIAELRDKGWVLCNYGEWDALLDAAEENVRLREKLDLWRPLTPEEAEAALDAAEAVPLSDEQIADIVKRATDPAEELDNSERAQITAGWKRERQRADAAEAELKEGATLTEELRGIVEEACNQRDMLADAVDHIIANFDALNGSDCTRECGRCIRCILKAAVKGVPVSTERQRADDLAKQVARWEMAVGMPLEEAERLATDPMDTFAAVPPVEPV